MLSDYASDLIMRVRNQWLSISLIKDSSLPSQQVTVSCHDHDFESAFRPLISSANVIVTKS